ncbi:hypothetical protein PTQ21_29050 [Paenibacillus marchantiae]|uniref:hypothetical protein n=1 Tax=Paenibacillus marchantiae TaxID=3026433 RepID=UPI00237B13D1|nr:hypothetical protein [Paenibacillus marchantiae]WDQ32380.1 hypothetical protein PTQ21_29050 [Paenibacillus marchantiae]
MLTEKELPIKYPMITSLPAFANMTAILCTHEDVFFPWLCHNHVQLVAWETPEVYIQFYTPVFREHYRLFVLHHYHKNVLVKWCDNITQFIIDAIDEENYVYLSIDQYYIAAYDNFRRVHTPHDMLIYGYNKENQMFYVADFFNSKYSFSKASFNSVNGAFLSPHSEGEWFKGVQLLQFNERKNEFKFDLAYLIKQLHEYLHEKKSSNDYKLIEEPGKDTDAWGIGVYRFLRKHITENALFEFSLIRSLHLLFDHKEVMLRSLVFLDEKKYITRFDFHEKAYGEIKQLCLILRNLCIKHSISEKTNHIKNIIELIEKIENEERIAVQELLSDLEEVEKNLAEVD